MARREDVIPALAEVFRTQGYEGASLSLLGEAAGLGKGSLYNFFPGGKEEMAQAVVTQIDGWFRDEMFTPLREAEDPRAGIRDMLRATDAYFHSGRRVCLIGAFALADSRDRFARQLELYFAEWVDALAAALRRTGMSAAIARGEAEDAVAAIQGALVLARAADDLGVFARVLRRLERRLLS